MGLRFPARARKRTAVENRLSIREILKQDLPLGSDVTLT
jgi:hypothetical protein